MFITFEGIDGCGKTTQVRRLVDRLTNLAVPVIHTLEPGDTRIGRDIRSILLDTKNKGMSPLAEVLLYAADRAQHLMEVIRPALSQNKWVVCDRFFDATTVYQGYARGQDIPLIKTLNEKTCLGVRPDMTILVDCPVEVGLKRAIERNRLLRQEEQARFEKENMTFHQAVRKGYLEVAEKEPDRFVVVDGTLSMKKLEQVIFEHIRPHIPISRG